MRDIIKKLLLTESRDEENLFKDSKQWLREDSFDSKFDNYIFPHEQQYFSKLNPLFLFKIKDINQLNLFRFVLVRDGSFSLIQFFISNPLPNHIKTILIIHSSLYYLIPSAWKDQILLYEYNSTIKRPKDPSFTLLLSSIHKNQCSTHDLQKIFERVDFNKPIVGSFFNNKNLRSEDNQEDDVFSNNFIRTACEYSQNKIEFVSWNELQRMNFEDSILIDVNNSNYLYSDSFAIFSTMSKGSYLDTEIKRLTSDNCFKIELSPFHEIVLSEDMPSDFEKISEEINILINDFSKSCDMKKNINRSDVSYEKATLISKELESLCLYLGERFV